MRKIFTLFFLSAFSVYSYAQTASLVVTQPPCNNDGIITVNTTGFTPPLTVTWIMQGQAPIVHTGVMTTTDQITNYSGAYMSVEVTDGSGQAWDNVSVSPFTYTTAMTPAICPSLGSGTVTVSGGLPPYTYNWYDINTNTSVSTANPASLPAGYYGIEITDANGCVFGTAQTLDSNIVEDIAPFNVTTATTVANCTNGSASVTGTPGTGVPPYTYLWSTGATTSSITGLVAGFYQVTVTDANGCAAQGYASVQQSIQIGANVTTTPTTCLQNNGALMTFGSGGMPPYTYQWSNGPTTQSQTGLPGGFYSVVVTDANGCSGEGYGFLSTATPITVTQVTTPSSCTAPTGSATLTISNGTAPYTTVWNTFPVQTGTAATGLSAGTYNFTVTDAVGCVRTGTVTIAPVTVVSGALSATAPSCIASNGAISVTASGGATPYTYLWNTGATTSGLTGIPAGGYNVTITDANGCVGHAYQSLNPTTPISIGLSTTNATCIYANDGAILAVPTGGTAPYTYTWSNGNTTNNPTGLGAGNYYVSVTDVNGCTKNAVNHVGYNPSNNSCYCTVEGFVYDDANNNCVQDLGELGIDNIQIHLAGFGYTYTDSGYYSMKVPNGSYTLSESVQTFYPLSTCQNNSIAVNVTASSGCTITNDFGNSITPIHSVSVSEWQMGMAVPGNNYYLNTIIANQGTVTEANLIAGFKDDGQLLSPIFSPSGLYTAGVPDYYHITGGSLTLGAAGSQAITKHYNVPTNIPINTGLVFKDTVSYTAPMSNWLNDYTPWNNVAYYQPVVVSSYDPNFKEVLPKGAGTSGTIFPQDSVLEYMVHFQNMGTWYAQNIVVLDTLDADLDWTTLRPIYSSHDCEVTIDDAGILKYEFKNINLPTKGMNELLSNGMFTYSIETKPNLAMGTQFTNSAAIYFDYNAPVITNTTLNTLGWPTEVTNAVSSADDHTFSVYPNPANGLFYAVVGSSEDMKAELNVVDVSGKVIISKSVNVQKGSQAITMDASNLSAGMYFVTLNSNGKVQTQKLVIMK
jgi:hypothetical protein